MSSENTVKEVDLPPQTGGIGGHPKGLNVLFFTELWERFSYYGMRALLVLFMVAPVEKGGLGFPVIKATAIYGWYTMLVYLTAIPGGWLADKFFGQRLAILYGGIIIAAGHFSMAVDTLASFYTGLVLIVIGTGLLKPNVSTIVGALYRENDPRRDGGFSIFYMGINLGALIAPVVCGYLGQKIGWHWGFAAAGVGMVFGLIQFVFGWKSLGNAGKKPEPKPKAAETSDAPAEKFTLVEWKRIGVICILFLFASMFWGAFEQAGSSLNLFADQLTNNKVFGWEFPSSWYQTLNPLYIILLAPLFSWLWVRLGKHDPSSPAKFVYGLVLVGLGFLVMAWAATLSGPEKLLVSPFWLVLCYLLHTMGELCLSPVGLSTVTKLAPARIVGLMMGVWFISLAVGNKLGGWVAGFFDTLPLPQLFGAVFVTTTAAGLLLAVLVKPIRKLMGGIH